MCQKLWKQRFPMPHPQWLQQQVQVAVLPTRKPISDDVLQELTGTSVVRNLPILHQSFLPLGSTLLLNTMNYSDISRNCHQGDVESERELKGSWDPNHTRPGGVWYVDHTQLCHMWCCWVPFLVFPSTLECAKFEIRLREIRFSFFGVGKCQSRITNMWQEVSVALAEENIFARLDPESTEKHA